LADAFGFCLVVVDRDGAVALRCAGPLVARVFRRFVTAMDVSIFGIRIDDNGSPNRLVMATLGDTPVPTVARL
jgi:hypothetical protein